MATITIPQTGGTIVISAKTTPNNTVLTTSAPEWVYGTQTLTATSMTLTIGANPDTTARTGTLSITAKTQPHEDYDGTASSVVAYSLSQDPDEEKYVKVIDYPTTASSNYSITSFSIVSNTTWRLSSNQSWAELSGITKGSYIDGTGNGNVKIIVSENTGVSRSATISVSSVRGTCTPTGWTITQNAPAPKYVTPSISTTAVTSASTSVTITISSNTSWSLSNNSTGWSSLSKTGGTGDDTVTLTIQENAAAYARTVTISVSSTAVTPSPSSVSVTQEKGYQPPVTLYDYKMRNDTNYGAGGLYLYSTTTATGTQLLGWGFYQYGQECVSQISATSITVKSISAVLSASSPYEVIFNGVSLKKYDSSGGMSFFSASTNGTYVYNTVYVLSDVMSYYVKPIISTTSVSSASTSVTITVSANTSWSLSSNASWATLSETSGSGYKAVTLSINANTGASRTATITASSTAVTPSPSSVSVTQEAGGTSTYFTWYVLNNATTSQFIYGASMVEYDKGDPDSESEGSGQGTGQSIAYTKATVGQTTKVVSVSLHLTSTVGNAPSAIKFGGVRLTNGATGGPNGVYAGIVNLSISSGTRLSITDV